MKVMEGVLEKGNLSPAGEARGPAPTMEALVYHGPGKPVWKR